MCSLPWTRFKLSHFKCSELGDTQERLFIVFAKGTWRQTWCHTCWDQLGVIAAVCGGETRAHLCRRHLNDTCVTYILISASGLGFLSSCTSADRERSTGVNGTELRHCLHSRAQCSDYNGPIKVPHLLVCPSPSPLLPSALSPSYPVFIRLCDFLIPLFSSRVWKLTLLRVITESPGLLIIWRDHHRDPRPCSPKPLML